MADGRHGGASATCVSSPPVSRSRKPSPQPRPRPWRQRPPRSHSRTSAAPSTSPHAFPSVPIARADTGPLPPWRHGKEGGGEERVLINEVAVRGKDGEPLEHPELEAAAAVALCACCANAALTVREDADRVVESGLFRSCIPVGVDSRDGIRLVFEELMDANDGEFRWSWTTFMGLSVTRQHASFKFLEDSFCGYHGKTINIRHLDQVMKSVNGLYQERGLAGLVSSYAEILPGGILRLQVFEAEVNNIDIHFLDKKIGEPTVGKTKPEINTPRTCPQEGQLTIGHKLIGTSKQYLICGSWKIFRR